MYVNDILHLWLHGRYTQCAGFQENRREGTQSICMIAQRSRERIIPCDNFVTIFQIIQPESAVDLAMAGCCNEMQVSASRFVFKPFDS